ncbi:hypothetical protein P0136_03850 [Lentisphaerota bacterium ZTH]|nr:hypothetical protein JYG24_05030 [Lentisphaerota bacterium]WET07132.1 hypothetical protein P0136_03850 [Lentisphaerota bacterium ZTH]
MKYERLDGVLSSCNQDAMEQTGCYEYFAGNSDIPLSARISGIKFSDCDDSPVEPAVMFDRSFEDFPKHVQACVLPKSGNMLVAWYGETESEPIEFERVNCKSFKKESVAWLRIHGEVDTICADEYEKLVGIAYCDGKWVAEVRRINNFQLREAVVHDSRVKGMFFQDERFYSISKEVIVAYPEERFDQKTIYSGKSISGWAVHPVEPFLFLSEYGSFKIIDLEKECVVADLPAGSDQNNSCGLPFACCTFTSDSTDSKAISFSRDGRKLFVSGISDVSVYGWREILRGKGKMPDPQSVINLNNRDINDIPGRIIVTELLPVNREIIIGCSSEGSLWQLNISTGTSQLLFRPDYGVRINKMRLAANRKVLAINGYHYRLDAGGDCSVENGLLLWKLNKLLQRQ